MKKIILSEIYLFLTMGIIAQTAVLNVKDNSESMKAAPVVSYFLPRTVLKIEVEAIKTIRKKGPYAADARKYFGTPAEIQQDEEIWTINKITVIQESEPDVANQYKVYARTNSSATLLTLTETGILKGINIPFSSDTKEVIGEGDKEKEKTEKLTSPLFISNFIFKGEKDNESEGNSSAAMAFDQINTLRETRLHILSQSNDVLQDGNAVVAYLREIDKREGELTALFNGKRLREVVEKTFIVYPDKEMKNQEIFYFSDKQGFSDTGDAIKITLKKKEQNRIISSAKGKPGFVYRIPALTNVEIAGEKTVFWTGEIIIAQLGRLICFPAGLFDKKNSALFDTKSGALLHMWK